jgi:cytochrome c oxidase cbb3-type subunit 3
MYQMESRAHVNAWARIVCLVHSIRTGIAAMTDPLPQHRSEIGHRVARYTWVTAMVALVCAAGLIRQMHATAGERLRARLVQSAPDSVVAQPDLVKAAVAEAEPVFAQHCAVCHGDHMQGSAAVGAPGLSRGVWLYGRGDVFDIERTILYGIRSANPKGHNVVDMPPYGLTARLRPEEIRQLVQYVLQLSGQPHDGQTALAGREIYGDRGGCGDCHGEDGRGNPDYGAPDLTANAWNNGGDADSLYQSIYFGRHRVMPAWIGILTLEQIRSVSVYVYVVSQRPHDVAARTTP